MMTNRQCYCYSVLALNNLIKNNIKLSSDSLYNELFYLWDIYSESHIEEIVNLAEQNGSLL